MQKSNSDHVATVAHRKVRSSTTLNRRYVKRPAKSTDIMVPVKRSSKIKHFDSMQMDMNTKKMKDDESIAPAVAHPMQMKAMERMQKRMSSPKENKMTAKELKDQAIKKALANASRNISDIDTEDDEMGKSTKMRFGLGRIVLALSCAVAAVFAIVYFVNLNMPDISIRVAAMQTGIEATYPNYVPRDFSLSDITSENGKIVLNFKNSSTGDAFSLIEESSSWDSSALLANFVKPEYGDDYSIVREQGLTIYANENNAAWVNGGVMYKIKVTSGSLTKKQIRSIATSL